MVDDVGGQLGRVHVDEAPAEPDEVAVADLGADDDVALDRLGAHPLQGEAVAGVEAARHVRARDEVEHRRVVTQLPGAEGLAEVGVEVDP